MYPNTFFSLFPPFPRNKKVFVAMSFDEEFKPRWDGVIAQAIINAGFEPHRVDNRNVSDSILTEILDGISNASLILADITVIGELKSKPIRNANVLYEVGLAHAKRLPEEILMFRSDDKSLLFDTYNVRVNPYDPDGNPTRAREQIISHIHIALREVQLQRSLAVEQGARMLDLSTLAILVFARSNTCRHPKERNFTVAEDVRCISRALEWGMLKTEFMRPQTSANGLISVSDLSEYRITPYGNAVLQHIEATVGPLTAPVQSV